MPKNNGLMDLLFIQIKEIRTQQEIFQIEGVVIIVGKDEQENERKVEISMGFDFINTRN
jgi:hypothetical protein